MSSVEPSQIVHPVLHLMSCGGRPHPEAETGDSWAAGAAAAVAGLVHSGKSGGGTRCWVCRDQSQVRLGTL